MENNNNKTGAYLAFDMDGVIYSAEGFIAEAYETAIKRSGTGLHYPNTDEILKQIGKPVNEIFLEIFGDLSEKKINALLAATRKTICEMILEDKGSVYDGMPDIIRTLAKDNRLFICSNAGIQYVETILQHYKLKEFFEPVLTLETAGVKNKNELLETYIANSNTNVEKWIMIGDRKTDLEAAEYNRCSFIGCYWGHGDMEELEGSNVIIEEPESLINAVKKVSQRNL